MEYPTTLYRITVFVDSERPIRAKVTRVPCRINAQTISTINKRRIAMTKLGQAERISESDKIYALITYTLDEADIPKLIDNLQLKMVTYLQRKMENVTNMHRQSLTDATVTVVDWEE